MNGAAVDTATTETADTDTLALAREAVEAAETVLATARRRVSDLVVVNGRIDGAKLEAEQTAAHGLAWLATTVEALKRLVSWADDLTERGQAGETERLILGVAAGEYLGQIRGGIPMAQTEMLRPHDLGLEEQDLAPLTSGSCQKLMRYGNGQAARVALADRLAEAMEAGDPDAFGHHGLDETLGMVREQFRRFGADRVEPHAHQWHLEDRLIPMDVVEAMAELGTFGLTVPEEYGGLGMGKEAMVVVSETLSRAYIGVGSLGTRSEIAAELIRLGGTEAQRAHWLPRIASGEILPTAVFTEPNTGSDLAHLRTRAEKAGEVWKVNGNKTWITHAARTDLMTLLVRTNPDESGYRGLSMLLAEKPRGTEENPFPAAGMSGGEIEVLGYRGMKEYEIAFDGFEVPVGSLLGSEEGQGFKQLMATFESARIQTAARAVGVAQAAMELGLRYANERVQFSKKLQAFPRVANKLARMAAEIAAARALTLHAAREKDSGRRCDIEAGMAKLLAARVAWACADDALQIHGGNGYALEYPISRVLCDARILNIFEGAAEIQAGVIARGLLNPGRN
ncbi:acyl-CoA dehydrogenase family protein [Thalassobaculum sp. OXR-137]|uniref:acyl-CoA dehydrogenase family protein n=1 Tax=Thalassobaculum sp. OXR-137 TaxID=3100173 RepID=UPI002AC994E8|nr:acyl-CoA dehydrogenase family protein [Thalassobaculum sp. OXR-137]WPZ35263.1 acyl-CoA dehydrogenase family protein [Thalassobaculum sp. OXR-137]